MEKSKIIFVLVINDVMDSSESRKSIIQAVKNAPKVTSGIRISICVVCSLNVTA